jgi:hypothetical protein
LGLGVVAAVLGLVVVAADILGLVVVAADVLGLVVLAAVVFGLVVVAVDVSGLVVLAAVVNICKRLEVHRRTWRYLLEGILPRGAVVMTVRGHAARLLNNLSDGQAHAKGDRSGTFFSMPRLAQLPTMRTLVTGLYGHGWR